MDENRKKLYDQLSANYDMGTFDEFDSDLDNEDNQKVAWQAVGGQDGYGDFGLFQQAIQRSPQAAETRQAEPAATQPDATNPGAAPMMEAQPPALATADASGQGAALTQQTGTDVQPATDTAKAIDDRTATEIQHPTTPKDEPAEDEEIVNEPDAENTVSAPVAEETVETDVVEPVRYDFTGKDADGAIEMINSLDDDNKRFNAYYDYSEQKMRSGQQKAATGLATARPMQQAMTAPSWSGRYNTLVQEVSDGTGGMTSPLKRGLERHYDRYNQNIDQARVKTDEQLRTRIDQLMTADYGREGDEMRAVDVVPLVQELMARQNGGHAQTIGERIADEYLSSHPELAEEYRKWQRSEAGYDSNTFEATPLTLIDMVKKEIDRRVKVANRLDAQRNIIPTDPVTERSNAVSRGVDITSAYNITDALRSAERVYGTNRFESYVVAFAAKHNMTVPQARERVRELVTMSVAQDIISALEPGSNTEYVLRKALTDNMVMNLARAGMTLASGAKPGDVGLFDMEDKAMAHYEQTHTSGWDQFMQVVATTSSFVVEGLGGGGFVLPGIVGKVVGNAAMKALSRAGGGLFWKRLVSGSLGGAANFGAFESQMEAVRQLKTGERNPDALWHSLASGLAKGAGFGAVGESIGRLFWHSRGWMVPVGEVVKLAGETATFSAIGYLETGQLTPKDWATNFGMALGGKLTHPVQYIADVKKRMDGGFGPKVQSISGAYRDELTQKGYGTLAKVLHDGVLAQEDIGRVRDELSRMRSDNDVPMQTLQLAEFALNGRVLPCAPATGYRLTHQADGTWTLTPLDPSGRPLGESITVKGTDAKNAAEREMKRQIEKNAVTLSEYSSRGADVTRAVGKAVMSYCDTSGEDPMAVYSVYQEALRKSGNKESLGEVERQILDAVGRRLDDTTRIDNGIESYKRTSREAGYDIDKILDKPVAERTAGERKALDEYKTWLGDREEQAHSDNIADFAEWVQRSDEAAASNSARIAREYEQRAEELRGHVEELRGRMDMGNVVVLENIDQVENAGVRRQIEQAERKGERGVPGWYDESTDTTYVYLPHAESIEDLDRTIMHEQVTHHGLRVLKTQGYNDLCDRVWNSMSDAERDRWENYPGVKDIDDQTKRQRAAADEYIANLAERTDPESAGLWSRFVAWAKEGMRSLGIRTDRISDAELEQIIRESYRNLSEQRGERLEPTGETEVRQDNDVVLNPEGEAPREEIAEPTADEVVTPTETVESPADSEGTGTVDTGGDELPVRSAAAQTDGQAADTHDIRELYPNDYGEITGESLDMYLEAAEQSRKQAHDYANGEAERPDANVWRYWASRDGLTDPAERQAEPVATEPIVEETPVEVLRGEFSEQIGKSKHGVELDETSIDDGEMELTGRIKVDGEDSNVVLVHGEGDTPDSHWNYASVTIPGKDYEELSRLASEFNRIKGRDVAREDSDALRLNFTDIDDAIEFDRWTGEHEQEAGYSVREGETFEEYEKRVDNPYKPDSTAALYVKNKYADRWEEITRIVQGITPENAELVGRELSKIIERDDAGKVLLTVNRGHVNPLTVLPFIDGISKGLKDNSTQPASQPQESDAVPENRSGEAVATETPTEAAQRATKLPKGANADATTIDPKDLPESSHIANMADAWGEVTRVEIVGQNADGTTRVKVWFKNRPNQRGIDVNVDMGGTPQPTEPPTTPPSEPTGSTDDQRMNQTLDETLGSEPEVDKTAADYMPMENKGGGRMSPNWEKATAEQVVNYLLREDVTDSPRTMMEERVRVAQERVEKIRKERPFKGDARSAQQERKLSTWQNRLDKAEQQLGKMRQAESALREELIARQRARGEEEIRNRQTIAQLTDTVSDHVDEMDLADYVAYQIGTGKSKLKWKDQEKGTGRTHGLGGHLGLSGSSAERKARRAFIDDKNGLWPEEYAELLYANMPEGLRARYSDRDVLNAVLDVMRGASSRVGIMQDLASRWGSGETLEQRIERERDEWDRQQEEDMREQQEVDEQMRRNDVVATEGAEAVVDADYADLIADARARLADPNASEFEKQAARAVLRFRQRDGRGGASAQGTEGDDVRLRHRAPNGKESRLDERQYDEVRTGNFKKWFGDWERVAQRDYILSDKYVTSLKGDEFAKTDEPLTDRVAKYYSDNYDGQIERENFGVVILDRRGVKDSISHGIGRTKSAAFAAVPEIIRDGIQIDQQENWKGRNQDSFTFAAPIEIGGKGHVGIVIVTRGKGSKRNRFYLHEVVIQENLQDESIKTGTKADSHHGDVAKVLKEIATAKNSSKIVDENGEPLVVYHQTNRKQYINRETGQNWDDLDWREREEWDRRSDEEWNDAWEEQDFYTFDNRHARQSVEYPGFFFSPRYDEYHEYGDRTPAAYLDMKNPAIDPDIPNAGVTDTAGRDAMESLMRQGYDGVIRTEDGVPYEYIVFRPEQIKSATENNGDFSRENRDIRFRVRDREYADAVAAGDREKVESMLREEAERKGYKEREHYQDAHGAPSAYVDRADFRNLDALRRSVEEDGFDANLYALANGISMQPDDYWGARGPRMYMYDDTAGHETHAAITSAMRDIQRQMREHGSVEDMPMVKVYRAVPNDIKGEQLEGGGGQWVSPSRTYAENHGLARFGEGAYRIIEQEVPADELWWDGNDAREWGYDDGTLGNVYQNTANNRKLLEPTYDDAGNLIPLSERFDRSNSDVRFRMRGDASGETADHTTADHSAAVEEARRRLESDDASEFERTAARAVIKAYGGGDDPDTPDGGGPRFRVRDDADMLVDMVKHNNEVERQRRDAVTDFVKAVTDVDDLTDSKFATALGKVMRGQRAYDQATVADITTMVKAMMDTGLLTELDNFAVKQILTKVKDSTGKNDITAEANKLIDIMLKHQLRRGKRAFEQQLKVKGMRQDSRGVVVQGGLDYHGQRAAKALKEGLSLGDLQAVNDRIDEAEQRLSDPDEVVRGNAADELEGLYIARQYYDEIKQSEINEANIKSQLEQAQADHKNGTLSDEAYKQLRQASNDALRELRCERVDAWARLNEQLSGSQSESAARAKQFREQQKQRQAEIQHWANSDMEGHSADPHEQETRKKSAGDKARDVAQAVLQPLGTFDKLMRYFGNSHPKGEGYLFGFVRRFMNVRDQWFKERKADFDQMDTAARRIGAAHGARVKVKAAGGKIATRSIKDWADVYTYINQQKPLTVTVKGKDYEITQGNATYLLAMEGQADGRMKLRSMGLTEADMDALRRQVDPMLLELSDWVVHGLLPGMRPRLNQTHIRMFGADMTDIPNYFPIRTSELARNETVNLAQQNGKIRPATVTGSIIERKRNNLDLDLGADFFQVTAEHIDEMNHWNSFAEFARDLNTLLSYKRFKAQVHNLHSWRYGNGADIWKTLEDTAAITTGDYQSKTSKADTIINGATKGLAAANITFRPYTGLKQLLSAPVYLVQARWDDIGYSLANLKGTWQWAIENLPTFAERWQGRMAGDPILTQAEQERGSQNKKLRTISKWGFAFNAGVDAVAVAIGARAIYRTKYRRYKDMGYSEEQANQKALEDAAISVNETQQSGLGAFTSVIQQDRTFWSRALTIYRNASMGYQRQLAEGLKAMRNGLSAEWRATAREKVQKKLERDGIDSAMATNVADRLVNREAMRGLALAAMFGSIAPFVWALGAQYLGYKMAGGDDDEQEGKMLGQASTHLLSGWMEGIVFGGQLSSAADFAYDYYHGRKKLRDYSLQRDLVSDMAEQILGKSSGKPADAVYDIVNMIVAMSTGVNPKSIVEPTVGIIDVVQNWGGDAKLAHEVALGWCRLLNVPQTSLDQVYVDEIGLSAKEARQLTAEQFAERWCRYKRRRGAGYMSPLTSAESDAEQEGKLLKRYERMMDERFESLSDERVEQIMRGSDDELLKKHAAKAYKSRIDALSDDTVASAMVPLSDSAPQDSVDVKREGIKRAYKSEGVSYSKPDDDSKNALAYERHATYDDIAEDAALKGRKDALKKSVGEKFEKMGVKYKNGSAGWDWYADDDASASIDEIKAYYQSHKAELDEYGILSWWFGTGKGSSGYIKKGFSSKDKSADEVMKEYRDTRKQVLSRTKRR